ncbi:sigma 54-interacting transcriptional regulator [Polyangium jinanense]|uniref:Sigma-54-dependent Fis family transcriptional regulator n=1 Tax=Polyangium jinanense TaxID=2829994 RepID=A0A9X3XG68_9BACT|nr:sigma 54-interacting transcriptional regulator [Polyangium jinanense]MDC3959645.1 sigma-54-dependent Fis family transcriptional regulator [Polyangium jinanense]MDC3989427.1 sigma-54-dependent Fis family transcriptional regulator [Polyangium jinanense]
MVRAYLGNPFFNRIPEGVSGLLDVPISEIIEVASKLVVDGLPRDARRLLLAAGHSRIIGPIKDGHINPFELLGNAATQQMGVNMAEVGSLLYAAQRVSTALHAFIGVSEHAQRVRASAWAACFGHSLEDTLILREAILDQNVLILGETGTGKEIIANAVQQGTLGAGRTPAPTQTVNAAALPGELAESELFGHEQGAFTGAVKSRKGKIVEADGGTVFLDEIGDLSLPVQAKLLRAIETDRITPVGSNKEIQVNVRYIAATSHPIEEMVERATFRRDLYERLAGCVIKIPPLRHRPEDIVPIGIGLLDRVCAEALQRRLALAGASETLSTPVVARDEAATYWLQTEAVHRPWHGNAREIDNVLRSWLLGTNLEWMSKSEPSSNAAMRGGATSDVPNRILQCKTTLKDVHDWYARRVLDSVRWNKSEASRILGIDRGTLQRIIKGEGGTDDDA